MRNEIAISAMVKAGWSGRNWYLNARREIDYVAAAEGWNRDRFAAILAVTSPRVVVRRNIRLALSWMFDGVLLPGSMKSIQAACIKYDDTGEISGPKVSAFYRNLSGDDDCITWDTHMFMAFVGRDRFRVAERKAAERILRSVAADFDITPAQCQAAVWAGWRALEGWNSAEFPVCEEWARYHNERVHNAS